MSPCLPNRNIGLWRDDGRGIGLMLSARGRARADPSSRATARGSVESISETPSAAGKSAA
jgi:hypothetical protein